MKLISTHINLNVSIKKSIPGNGFTGTPAQNGEWLTFKEGMCVLTEQQEKRIIEIAGEIKTLAEWIRGLRGYGTDFIEVPDEQLIQGKSAEPDHITIETENGRIGGISNHRNDQGIYNKATIQEMIDAAANKKLETIMPSLIELVKKQLATDVETHTKPDLDINIPNPIVAISDEKIKEEEEKSIITDTNDTNSDSDITEVDGIFFYNDKSFPTISAAKASKRMTEINNSKKSTKNTK